MSRNPIEAFLFDMGDVLIKFSHAKMYAQLAEVVGRPSEEIRRRFERERLMGACDRGDVGEDELSSMLERFSDRPLDRQRLVRAVVDIFEPSPGMFEILTELKKRGYRMVMLSNTFRWHIDWVRERFPIFRLLDDYALSFEVGAVKPEPAIFHAAIAKAGVPPERCFYTDDIPAYVEVGRSLGLQADVFTGAENLKKQLAERGIEL